MIKTYPKGSFDQLSPNFRAREFDCPCRSCSETLICEELVQKLEAMREAAGNPLRITSAYRCESHQENLKAKGYETAIGISSHQLGMAVDLTSRYLNGPELAELAKAAGFQAVGTAQSWIHVDTRADKERRWFYSK